jgi:hypothetical protein
MEPISTSSEVKDPKFNKILIIVLIAIIAVLVLFIAIMVIFPAIRCPSTFGFLIRSAFSSQGCVYVFPPDNRFFMTNAEKNIVRPANSELMRASLNVPGANTSGANTSGANTSGANTSGANTSGANISGANKIEVSFNKPFRISNDSINKNNKQTFYVYVDLSNKLGNLSLTTQYNEADVFTYNDLLWKFGRQKVVIREKNKKLFVRSMESLSRMSEEEKKKSAYWFFEKGIIWDYERKNAVSVVNYIHIKNSQPKIAYFLTMIPKENIGCLETSWSIS